MFDQARAALVFKVQYKSRTHCARVSFGPANCCLIQAFVAQHTSALECLKMAECVRDRRVGGRGRIWTRAHHNGSVGLKRETKSRVNCN